MKSFMKRIMAVAIIIFIEEGGITAMEKEKIIFPNDVKKNLNVEMAIALIRKLHLDGMINDSMMSAAEREAQKMIVNIEQTWYINYVNKKRA